MALRDFPALTIAAIRGAAVGAGMALGLACDFRVGDPTAAFTTGFISAGSAGDFGGSYLLTQLIGPARAKEALVFNETFDATTAHGLGLLNRLVEAEEWEPTWRDMAGRIAAGPRLAQRVVKENVNRAVESDLRTCLDYEAFATIALMQSEDHAEARRAFADRRPPRFGGE
jgi:2-(1,2-epoxy-1,2-dihydrophenyl)acetyl-CoA isomerase